MPPLYGEAQDRNGQEMSIDALVAELDGDPLYVRYLLGEMPYIKSALYARGVCLDEESRATQHSSTIGNALHLDIIELESWFKGLAPQDQELLIQWILNDSPSRQPYSQRIVKTSRGKRIRALTEEAAERISGDGEEGIS